MKGIQVYSTGGPRSFIMITFLSSLFIARKSLWAKCSMGLLFCIYNIVLIRHGPNFQPIIKSNEMNTYWYILGFLIYFFCLVVLWNAVLCERCQCNNNNTLSCNQTSGDCVCRAGFEGPSCDCIAGRHSCNHTTSYCSLHGDSPVCVCRPGMYGKNLGCFGNFFYHVIFFH